jgi:hypothetical protein
MLCYFLLSWCDTHEPPLSNLTYPNTLGVIFLQVKTTTCLNCNNFDITGIFESNFIVFYFYFTLFSYYASLQSDCYWQTFNLLS